MHNDVEKFVCHVNIATVHADVKFSLPHCTMNRFAEEGSSPVNSNTPSSTLVANIPTSTILPRKTDTKERVKKDKKEMPSVVAGAVAGALSRTAMAPVERIKLLLQLQGSLHNKKYESRNAWTIARNIVEEQGFLAFWRGNTPSVLRQAGSAGLSFMFLDFYKSIAASGDLPAPWWKSFLSGGLAGGTATTILYPIEFLRTRLAMDIGSGATRQYSGMGDILVKTVRTDGVSGLYQGYGVALGGVFVYRALHLGGYDLCKRELLSRKRDTPSKQLSLAERFVVAQAVSLVAGTICYPIDSVRRRMMMQAGMSPTERLYTNSWHCFRAILAKEGLGGFYLGIGPNLVRSFGGALLLVAYDFCKEL